MKKGKNTFRGCLFA